MKKRPANHNYLTSLTSFRGVGALLIVLGHAESGFHIIKAIHLTDRKLYLLVDLFFILSGFVITLGYVKLFKEKITLESYRKFLWARFLRIYPLHIVILSILAFIICAKIIVENIFPGIVVAPLTKNAFSFPSLISNVLLIQSWHIHQSLSWDYPSWSISCEWMAYLLFPVFAVFLKKLTRALVLSLLAFCLIGYAELLFLSPNWVMDITYDYGVIRCLLGFCFGALLCRIYMDELPRLITLLKSDTAFALIAAVLIACAWFELNDLLILPLLGLLILVASYNGGFFYRMMNRPLPQYLGKISYSIYLVHTIILMVINGSVKLFLHKQIADLSAIANIGLLAFYLAATLSISGISYVLIEVKLQGYIKRIVADMGEARKEIPAGTNIINMRIAVRNYEVPAKPKRAHV